MDKKYRHEFKYLCSSGEIEILKERIQNMLPCDDHVGANGVYTIRSVYFDDYYNSCYYDNESGVDNRKKYRIRIYNCSSDYIHLECKEKVQGKTLKRATDISLDNCMRFLTNKPPNDMTALKPLERELSLLVLTKGFHPVTIVEYERRPFIFKDGNVRVTFDMNIRSSNSFDGFFERSLPQRQILKQGQQLLEVKFDEFLPHFIKQLLQLDSLQSTSFSKYYLCRKYFDGILL